MPAVLLLPLDWEGRGRCGLVLLLLLLLMSGCALQRPAPEAVHWEAHQQQLLRLHHWQLEGKLGYRSPEQNGSAFIHWQQRDDSFELSLRGPFGAGATRISGDDQLAILQRAGQQPVRAATATELTEWLFGWPLPVVQMTEWVKGVPAGLPRRRQIELNDSGQLGTLRQAGWQLHFDRYQQVGEWLLPGRIRGSRGELAFTLVVRQWQLDEQP